MTTVADQRIQLGTVATARAQFVDQEGDPVAPSDTADVTVHVVDLAGDDVLAEGTATTLDPADGTIVTVELPRADQVDLYTCTWTEDGGAETTTTVEVAGRFYASPTAIRASDEILGDTDTYPTWKIIQARRAVEDEFERVIGYALVPRIAVHTTRVAWVRSVTLPHLAVTAVRSVTLDGVAVVGVELEGPPGVVHLPAGCEGQLTVVYEHGLEAPNGEALDAFYTRVRDVLNRANRGINDRATTFTSDVGGTYALAVAGRGGSLTGIPDVDVVLRGLARRTPGIA